MNKFTKFLGFAVIGVMGLATNASAALGDGFAVDTAPVITVATVVLGGIGSIWAVKKVIALGNKS